MKTDFSPISGEQWAGLNDHVISHILGCSDATVARKRKALGLDKVRKPGSGRPARVNPSRFRLDETNLENAARLGITPQRAGQLRKKLSNHDEWL